MSLLREDGGFLEREDTGRIMLESAQPVSYITINGLMLTVKGGTWHPNKPAPDWGTGINGDRWRSIGAEAFKWSVECTVRYQKIPAIGYAGKGDLDAWTNPTTLADTLLTVIDVDGVTRAMFAVHQWLFDGDTYESAGDDEWYEMKLKLVER